MIAADILEVPLFTNNNRYLLVVQDYFTKWAEAILLLDQTAARITEELIKLFSVYGHPKVFHSDQCRNFESSILTQTLEAFGVHKFRTTAYHPQGDGIWLNVSTSLFYNYYKPMLTNRMTGNATCHLCCMRIALLSTHLPGLHLYS